MATISVLALLGGGALFLRLSSPDVGPVAMETSTDGDASTPSAWEEANRSGAEVSSAIAVSSIEPMSPQQIVDEWFQIREASEEGQTVRVLEKESPEYEERVQRFIEGEKRSRELFRIALVSPTGDEARCFGNRPA